MSNQFKIDFLAQLEQRYGKLKKLPNGLSLFEIGDGFVESIFGIQKFMVEINHFMG